MNLTKKKSMELKKNFFKTKGKYQYQQVFGLNKKQSADLFDFFKSRYLKEIDVKYTERQAIYEVYPKMTARKKIISEDQLKWYFHIILYYIRHYPTLEVLGWQLGKFKQDAHELVLKWFMVFIKSLSDSRAVPARDLNQLKEVGAYLLGEGVLEEEDLDLIIDVTERQLNRPFNYDVQKEYYSGKKKCHTIKNTVVSTVCLMVLFLGKTYKGTTHDFQMFKEEFSKDKWSKVAVYQYISLWVDLGYIGIKKWCNHFKNIFIPHKKPRATKMNPAPKLTKVQKKYNTFVSQTRIRGEHAIGSIKISRIVSHKFRGRKENLEDEVILAATAIHNFKLMFLNI